MQRPALERPASERARRSCVEVVPAPASKPGARGDRPLTEAIHVVAALASYPAFFVLRAVNAAYFLEALWSELVLRRSLLVYEKGH